MGRVVVGVDGSPGGQAALRFALAEARLRGATLQAVHAWTLPLYEGVPGPFVVELPLPIVPPLDDVRARLQAHAEEVLARALADVLGGEEPGVEVTSETVEAAPAAALLERAEGADLLVVGSRGRGGFRGLLLGSVGQQCAQHASCPVAVVPPPRTAVGSSP